MSLKKRLLQAILLSSPIVALVMTTPVFIASNLPIKFFPLILGMGTIIALINWLAHAVAFYQLKGKWATPIRRYFVVLGVLSLIIGATSGFVPRIPDSMVIDTTIAISMRFLMELTVSAITFIIFHLIVTVYQKEQLSEENNRLSLANLEAQHKQLKEQLNPHFLFNALSMLKSLIRRKPDLAQEYLVKLSDFLRQCVRNNKDMVSLEEEVKLCNDYLDLQKVRFRDALQYSLNISTTALHTYQLPFFSLQLLAENAIKHNILTPDEPLHIDISIDNEQLVIVNNLQLKTQKEPSTKAGLQNLGERYKILIGRPIHIEKTDQHFSIHLPLQKL